MCETENSLYEENNSTIKLSDVYATLSGKFVHGRKSDWIALYILLSVGAALLLIGVLLLILSFNVDVVCGVLCLLIGSVLTAVIVYVMMRWKKGNSQVEAYLQDSVPLHAYAYKVDEETDYLSYRNIRIQVHFKYGTKKYKIFSPITWEGRFDSRYKQYADKKIIIWYSPCYNEVMLLRNITNVKASDGK